MQGPDNLSADQSNGSRTETNKEHDHPGQEERIDKEGYDQSDKSYTSSDTSDDESDMETDDEADPEKGDVHREQPGRDARGLSQDTKTNHNCCELQDDREERRRQRRLKRKLKYVKRYCCLCYMPNTKNRLFNILGCPVASAVGIVYGVVSYCYTGTTQTVKTNAFNCWIQPLSVVLIVVFVFAWVSSVGVLGVGSDTFGFVGGSSGAIVTKYG